jgi:hypothetical protein
MQMAAEDSGNGIVAVRRRKKANVVRWVGET